MQEGPLSAHGISFHLKRRAFQKRLRINIKSNGEILVSANKTYPYFLIKRFLLENKPWIENSLSSIEEKRRNIPTKTFQLGESFLYLGKHHRLSLNPIMQQKTKISVQKDKFELLLDSPTLNPTSEEIYDALIKFYKDQGRLILTERVRAIATLTKMSVNKITIRGQRSRWGSCNIQKDISLNWKLIISPKKCIDYVVLHELCHTVHHNHSKRFWQLVETYMPDYLSAKKWLDENHFEFEFL
ncbi:MAG: M48 family metallopeptidase [Bdellovibrionales bacterium]|nr:M48 family metallopeptidase [Bdellovibrionales bacterium]